jgi:hypothetical protein
LLVIDTESTDLAPSIKHDKEHMRILLEDHIPEGRRKIDVLDGKKVTREAILNYYKNLSVGPDDVLLFFYAGHGAIDEKTNQHNLTPQGGITSWVPRAEVRKAMEAKKAGLVVLLTDCCSTRIAVKPGVNTRKAITDVKMHPVLRSLLFLHRGTVDVTAAEDGTGSWGDDDHGGVFTGSLVSLLEGDLKTLDKDHDGFLSWKKFFPQLQKETEKQFKVFADRARANKETVDQTTQRPRSFALPDAPAKKTYAVVSLKNVSAKAIRYKYRWSGEKEWKEDTLAEKGKKCYDLVLADGAKLPNFEIESLSDPEGGSGSLEPKKWSGTVRPQFEDGKYVEINTIPKKAKPAGGK